MQGSRHKLVTLLIQVQKVVGMNDVWCHTCQSCYQPYIVVCFSVNLPTCLHMLRRSYCISKRNHKNILLVMGFWEILSGTVFF